MKLYTITTPYIDDQFLLMNNINTKGWFIPDVESLKRYFSRSDTSLWNTTENSAYGDCLSCSTLTLLCEITTYDNLESDYPELFI